jgi:hypothetical protein
MSYAAGVKNPHNSLIINEIQISLFLTDFRGSFGKEGQYPPQHLKSSGNVQKTTQKTHF